MPNRVFSDRAWASDKIKKVPEEYRAEYAWIYSLALCDGTFECDPEKVWASCYAPARVKSGRGAWTVAKVADMLNEFVAAGLMLRRNDREGKQWGFWVGCEATLPPRGHWHKYQRGKGFLFTQPDEVRTSAGPSPEFVPSGIGLGKGKGNGIGLGADTSAAMVGGILDETLAEQESGSTNDGRKLGTPGYFKRGQYPGTSPKAIFQHVAKAWSNIRGEAAVCRYPSKYPETWELLCDTKSGDLIVPAFELWAVKNGYSTEWPVTDFLKVAQDYMAQVIPLNEMKPKTTAADEKVIYERARQRHLEVWGPKEEKQKENEEPGADAFLESLEETK